MGLSVSEKEKPNWLPTAVVYFACVVPLVMYAFFKTSWSRADLTFVEMINPGIVAASGWTVLVVCISISVVGLIALKTGWLRYPWMGVLLGVVGGPVSIFCHTITNLAPWTTHGRVQGQDGAVYVFCDSSFLQGQTMAICELLERGDLKSTYRVLVWNNGDSPRSWASVIRPVGSLEEYGQLFLKNGLLVGVRHRNRCYLAYDLVEKEALGHGRIESISPFVCLDANDALIQGDLTSTCERIAEYADFCHQSPDIRHAENFLNGASIPGCPSIPVLENAITNRPILVVSAARLLLECYAANQRKLVERIAKRRGTENAKE